MTREGPRHPHLSRSPLFALALLIAAACSDRPAGPPPKEETGPGVLRIVVELPGDDIPSPAVTESLGPLFRGLGTVVRSGAGMGRMELWLAVGDRGCARGEIEAVLLRRFPAARVVVEPGASPER